MDISNQLTPTMWSLKGRGEVLQRLGEMRSWLTRGPLRDTAQLSWAGRHQKCFLREGVGYEDEPENILLSVTLKFHSSLFGARRIHQVLLKCRDLCMESQYHQPPVLRKDARLVNSAPATACPSVKI